MTAMEAGPVQPRFEVGTRRVRVLLGGCVVADTTNPFLVWEHRRYPVYYIARGDVRARLSPTGAVRPVATVGMGEIHDVTAGERTAAGAALVFPEGSAPALRDTVRFDWDAMDEWLEEDEPVYTHARDPYKRIDILSSSRHVIVALDGVTVAETRQPRILFETGLPPRYYVPLTDVRLELLRPSDRRTRCAYKGEASYWSLDTGVSLHRDVAWMYRTPLAEAQRITGLLCFFNERSDITIDGVLQDRPSTPFS